MGSARISYYLKFPVANGSAVAIPYADQIGNDVVVATSTGAAANSNGAPAGAYLAIVTCDEAMYYDYGLASDTVAPAATNQKRILKANTDIPFLIGAGGIFSFLDVA